MKSLRTSIVSTRFALPALVALAVSPVAEATPIPPSSVTLGASPPASATPSASASSAPAGPTVASYAWPTTSSPEPKAEEWTSATVLESVTASIGSGDAVCTQRVVREWMRISCTPSLPDTFFGVLWGWAGDLDLVKGTFGLAADVIKKPPTNEMEQLTMKMGARADVTFQARPGTAFLVTLERMGWDDSGWDGPSLFVSSGAVIDVSWALGEKGPTVLYR